MNGLIKDLDEACTNDSAILKNIQTISLTNSNSKSQSCSIQSDNSNILQNKNTSNLSNHDSNTIVSNGLIGNDSSLSSSNECTLSTHSSFTDKIVHQDNNTSPNCNRNTDEKDDQFDDIQLNSESEQTNPTAQPEPCATQLRVSNSICDNLNNGMVSQVLKANHEHVVISSFSSLSSLVSTGTEPSLFTPSIAGEDAGLYTDQLDENGASNLQTKRLQSQNHTLQLPSNSELSFQGESKEGSGETSIKRSLSKISSIFSRKSKSSLTGSNSSLNSNNVISTTGLILQDRPEGLPMKSPDEIRKHEEEYKKIIESIKKRDLERQKSRHVATERQLEAEDRLHRLLQIWRKEVLTDWSTAKTSSRFRKLWWEGVPSAVRAEVWKLAIGNDLQINKQLYDHCLNKMRTRMLQQKNCKDKDKDKVLQQNKATPDSAIGPDTIYDAVSTSNSEVIIRDRRHSGATDRRFNRESSINIIKLDVSRTFPILGLFQDGGPYYDSLHNLLGAYVCYRPDIGYIQGMSFIAAVLILTMNSVEDAFICFANILNKPCHHAFYSLDELLCDVYFKVFDKLFTFNLPRLHSHFIDYGIEANLYLFDWIFTLFSRTLPLEASFRVWDLFCRDGEEALFRSALGLLKMFEDKLLSDNFDGMAEFLTGTMPESMKPNDLLGHIKSISMETEDFLNFNDLLTSEQNKAVNRLTDSFPIKTCHLSSD